MSRHTENRLAAERPQAVFPFYEGVAPRAYARGGGDVSPGNVAT